MLEAAVPAGRLYGPADMVHDPHFAAREAVLEVEHPKWPGLKMQGFFPKLSETPGRLRRLAPQTVGQDNAEVLGALGLSGSELEGLHTRGVI